MSLGYWALFQHFLSGNKQNSPKVQMTGAQSHTKDSKNDTWWPPGGTLNIIKYKLKVKEAIQGKE